MKAKEREINHDLKAVEYFLKENFHLQKYSEYFHACCTSEDINNLSYSLMFSDALASVVLPSAERILEQLKDLAVQHAGIAMIGRTHGQPATPTTLGKEFANFAYRVHQVLKKLRDFKLRGKCNGAVGNFNAHKATFPQANWVKISRDFVEGLGLDYSPYTTQIEPHDKVAELCGEIAGLNSIVLGLCRDMWGYISLGYFTGKVVPSEVGSSTMPHKVNPIYFENAEGNLGIANSLLVHLQHKLPISRFQRDLSDSTALRNVGSALGYSVLAYESVLKGFSRASVNGDAISRELDNHWEILAEPIQMILRKHGYSQPYELLKEHTMGSSSLTEAAYSVLVNEISESLKLPIELTIELQSLSPANYTGLAKQLALEIVNYS